MAAGHCTGGTGALQTTRAARGHILIDEQQLRPARQALRDGVLPTLYAQGACTCRKAKKQIAGNVVTVYYDKAYEQDRTVSK